jgi:hypothetical protein
MKKLCVVLALMTLALAGGASVFGQSAPAAQVSDPHVTANGVIGDIVAVEAGSKQIYVKTDAGSVVVITVADSTIFRRINPSKPSAEGATAITFAELGPGDRVLARGKPSDDRKTLAAPKMIFVSTKADLAAKQESDRAEWSRRGIVGVVSAINPESKEITLQTRGPQGPQPVVIQAGGANVKFRRYAPDSVLFNDAKPSSIAELKVGDQLRAKGDKNAEGTIFTPEEVVSGTFRTWLGTISAVNAEKKEFTITQMTGGAPLTVVVSKDSILKHIPEDMMARMGGGGAPGGPGAAGGAPGQGGGERRPVTGPGGGAPPAGGSPAAGGPGAAGGAGQRRPGGPDMQRILEMLPPTTVADLKPGRMVVVLSTAGNDPTRITAIQLVAGIEPIVAMMSGRPGGAGRPGGPGGPGGGDLSFGFGIGQP